MERNTAETLAILAFSFLLADDARRARFLDLTGVDPDDLRAAIARPEFQAAILDHVSADERILMAFADDAGIAPGDVEEARTALAGRRWERDSA
jgi:hypothetical protein